MIVGGIDPGKTGALVILFPDNTCEVFRVPLAGKVPAWTEWETGWHAGLFLSPPELIGIENVGSMPGQGVSSTFKFGESLGFIHALALSVRPRPRIEWPTPAVWKRKMGLTSDKNASREEARRLMPSLIPELSRVKDDGVAEAALIAWYTRKYL